MAATQQQEQQPPQQPTKDLLSLPDDLLRICLRAPACRDELSKRNALASSKPLARAALRTSLRAFVLDVDDGHQYARSFRTLVRLWGEEEEEQLLLYDQAAISLALSSFRMGDPARCVPELADAGVAAPFLTRLVLQARQRCSSKQRRAQRC